VILGFKEQKKIIHTCGISDAWLGREFVTTCGNSLSKHTLHLMIEIEERTIVGVRSVTNVFAGSDGLVWGVLHSVAFVNLQSSPFLPSSSPTCYSINISTGIS
jgi:hypothetical protein